MAGIYQSHLEKPNHPQLAPIPHRDQEGTGIPFVPIVLELQPEVMPTQLTIKCPVSLFHPTYQCAGGLGQIYPLHIFGTMYFHWETDLGQPV